MKENVYFLELNKENLMLYIKEQNIMSLNQVENINDIYDIDTLKSLNLKQGIIYNYDSVEFDNIENLNVDIDNLIEGRFFNESSEICIRKEDDKIYGYIVYDFGDEEEYIKEELLIYDKDNRNKFTKLEVKKYISYDRDNQANIEYMKPVKLR